LTEFTLALFIEYHNLIRSNVLFLNLIVVETTEVFRGCLYSVDWTRDWTVGLDSQKVALIRFRSSTHTTTLQYTYIT